MVRCQNRTGDKKPATNRQLCTLCKAQLSLAIQQHYQHFTSRLCVMQMGQIKQRCEKRPSGKSAVMWLPPGLHQLIPHRMGLGG